LLELGDRSGASSKLLILDEPTQGLTEEEIAAFCGLVREIAKDATVLPTEHNVSVVSGSLPIASQ
jgi:branched-chain amino acid transport system ATP-binding protein